MLDAAVRNNAAWCEAVCRAQDIPGHWSASCWTAGAPVPPFYPDLITLVPDALDAQREAVSRIADARRSWSAKDSYASLDLRAFGATVLFDAQWQFHAHESGIPPGDVSVVGSEAELREWEEHWRTDPALPRIFHPGLLSDRNAAFLAIRSGGSIIAGAALYVAHGVCGLTNLFGTPENIQPVMAAAMRNDAGLPLVFYARARVAGFTPLGPLRIWISNGGESNA